MKVAVPLEKHSPRLGQAASSQTVYKLFSRRRALSCFTRSPIGALARIQDGLRCTFTEGTTHRIVQVSITTGTLDIAGSQPDDFAGLAGIQIIEQEFIPTINEWGMIIFVLLTGLGAVYYLRRQKTVKS